MAELTIIGHSDDVIDFGGAVNEEFYVRPDGTWEGWLQSPDGKMVNVRATFCQINPEGWKIELLTECPWKWRESVHYTPGNDMDFFLVMDVPEGIMVEEVE